MNTLAFKPAIFFGGGEEGCIIFLVYILKQQVSHAINVFPSTTEPFQLTWNITSLDKICVSSLKKLLTVYI